jgi:hypothetical protein
MIVWLLSGDNLVIIGNLMRRSVGLFRSIPLGDGVSERDRAADAALRADVEAVVLDCAAACWLIAQMRMRLPDTARGAGAC